MAKLKEPRQWLSNVSLSPFAAHYYCSPVDGFQASKRHTANAFNLKDNTHDGVISMKGRKRLEKAIAWLLYYAKVKYVTDHETGKKFHFKINFITLTLPATQVHSDPEITNRCLGNFLEVCKKEVNLTNYIWRAEAQANGNIHYHLVTDCFIHYNNIRKWWNQSVELLGYVSAFEFKWKHRNPKTEDVHSVKHVNRLSSYLSKYMAKERAFACIGELRLIKGEPVEVLYGSQMYRSESANKKTGKVIGHILGGRIRLITSRLWMCSRSISRMKNIKIGEDEFIFSDLSSIINRTEKKVYQGEYVRSLYGDFTKVVDWYLEQQPIEN